MALPIAGAWAASNANANQYAGTTKWGTGAHAIHSVWGEGPPLSITGRTDGPTNPETPLTDVPPVLESPETFGYTTEDIQTTIYAGMPPEWGSETDQIRSRNATGHPDWGTDPTEITAWMNNPEMDQPLWNGTALDSFPTETVSEGWLNKTTGNVNAAEVSDQEQYERQTSMQQVNPAAGRNNAAAVDRRTDDPRSNILTRLTGMKLKPWSQGQRNADMFPYQQDMILRPFWYRTAGTADPAQLEPNAMVVTLPVQRQVPTDPYLGPDETALADGNYGYADQAIADGYGYTPDDITYIY